MVYFIYIVILLFSVILHEVAHGYIAYLKGDDTAKKAGRLTLNPIPHIDMYGSIIIPALFILTKAPLIFGYAKPVPVNYSKLRNPRTDIPLVSAAGPVSNVLLAVVAGLCARVAVAFVSPESGILSSLVFILYLVVRMNIVLVIINLIPIPSS